MIKHKSFNNEAFFVGNTLFVGKRYTQAQKIYYLGELKKHRQD